jgi:hypothetical protein
MPTAMFDRFETTPRFAYGRTDVAAEWTVELIESDPICEADAQAGEPFEGNQGVPIYIGSRDEDLSTIRGLTLTQRLSGGAESVLLPGVDVIRSQATYAGAMAVAESLARFLLLSQPTGLVDVLRKAVSHADRTGFADLIVALASVDMDSQRGDFIAFLSELDNNSSPQIREAAAEAIDLLAA